MIASDAAQLLLKLSGYDVNLYGWQRRFIDDDSRFRIMLKPRGVGATFTVALEALTRAFTKPASTTILLSYSLRQSLEIFRHVKQVLDRLSASSFQHRGTTYCLAYSSGERAAVLANGSRIVSLPNNPDTLRGYRADAVYVDEAALFRDDFKVRTAVMFTTVARQGRIALVSTPKGRRGWFYRAWTGEEGWSKHLVSYTQAPHITQADITQLRSVMTDLEWRQEMECEFLDEVNAFIPYEKILSCVEDYQPSKPSEESRVYLGVDFGRFRDSTVVVGLARERDGRLRLCYLAELKQRPFREQLEVVAKAAETLNPVAVAVDSTGMGAPLAETLSETVRNIMPVSISSAVKQTLVNNLRNIITSERIVIPADATALINQLRHFQQITADGATRYEAPTGMHDDYVMALALACYAAAADHTAQASAVNFWSWPSPPNLRP
ncbi:MAG: terminase family protein [Candidatus Caldarchaeum sp.]|nr:terminase family protein [Candidatus Caldarchaeum sp.]